MLDFLVAERAITEELRSRLLVIALIEDAGVIRRILEHLGLWAPREGLQRERAPPEAGRSAERPEQLTRILTYHPVPDIASAPYP